MKKIVSFMLLLVFVVSIVCTPVSAEPESMPEFKPQKYTGGFLPIRINKEDLTEVTVAPKRTVRMMGTSKSLYDFLEEQLLARVETITIYPTYKVSIEDFSSTFFSVVLCNCKVFAYPEIKNARYSSFDGCFISFKPVYFTPEEGIEAAGTMIDEEIDKYLAAAAEIPDSDVVGKMLVIHDLFCKNNKYATEELNEEINTQTANDAIRTAYYLFKNNRAVCQGNAIALKAIYDALNENLKENETDDDVIETTFCSSDRLGHMWNVVKVGGKWYHLDETWDDSTYEGDNGAIYSYHSYFLKSSDEMGDHIKNDVYDWAYYADEDVVCDDKKYEDGYIFSNSYERPCIMSYDNNKYRIDFVYIPEPFLSNSIKSTSILATDAVGYGMGKIIYYYAKDAVTARSFWTRYDEEGEMTDSELVRNISINSGFSSVVFYNIPSGCRLFHWAEDGITPLCRAMTIE